MFCKKCGYQLNDGVTFCPYCGEKNVPETANVAADYPATDYAATDYAAADYAAAPAPAPAPAYGAQQSYQGYQNSYNPAPAQPQFYAPAEPQIPAEYKPLSPWAYFGYQLLFCIPVVGFILLIVFSVSSGNINRRNFARSYWCLFAISLVIGIIIGILTAITGASMSYYF